MKQSFTYLLALLVLVLGTLAPARAQTLDPTFQPTTLKVPFVGGVQTGPQLTLVQPDGKLLVAGGFDFANGTLASKITRLNADGTPDATFNPGGAGANGFIGAMALQADGKIIIVGGFTAYNGVPTFCQARLNANGTLDPSFAALPVAERRQLGSVAVQPDGKILIGGNAGFDATPLSTVRRLNADGTPDASFTPPASSFGDFVRSILVQADGKIVLGGNAGSSGSVLIAGLQRLNADGSADGGFTSPLGASAAVAVYALAQQPDGKLLVGGALASTSTANPGVIRLQTNGQLDNTFATGSGPVGTGGSIPIRTIAILPNGNILVGGVFTQYNGVARGRLVQLLPTGAVDTGFATGAGANNVVTGLAATASGQVLAVGNFTQYDAGGTRTGLVRLTSAGAEDGTFSPPVFDTRGSIGQAALLANGQLLVQGNFTSFNGATLTGAGSRVRRLNADGTLDASYNSTASALLGAQPDGTFFNLSFTTTGTQYVLQRVLPTGVIDNSFANPSYSTSALPNNFVQPQGVVVQPDGKILVYGAFTNFGGATRNGLVRLNADGTVDNSFVPPTGTLQRRISSLTLQASGKLVISYYELQAGSLILATTTGTILVRLNADGSLDNTFASGTGANAGAFFGVLAQPDGRLLLSGLSSFNGQAAPYGLLRLTADGAVDNTFNQLVASYSPVLVQPDGRILVTNSPLGTTFGLYGAIKLLRLNSNGSLDATFAPISTPAGLFIGDNFFNGYLYQPADGKIITYGSFTSVLGQPRVGLARLVPGVATATQSAHAALPLAVYPNPARQQLTVVLPALAQPAPATLLSLTGQVVRQWPLPARQLEAVLRLDGVAAGLYVLRIASPDGVYQQKVMVAP